MKTMTCRQLGGACSEKFHAASFDEIAEMSKNHGTEMYHKSEEKHLKAMGGMQQLMKDPGAMKEWFDRKRKDFDELPED